MLVVSGLVEVCKQPIQRHTHPPATSFVGGMFWLSRKRLVGS